ncbi:MAG: Grx4 family monothiol glutaredoxin [Methylococcales bacterium]|nr:Grx4 family monothiol glutaredoxin [Methylococcales bacterium]MDP3839773.1 Grx4 family monothiol glutaredoxin [Methylococcales bacterium]
MTTEEKIKKQLADNAIILYMKGVPTNPECGFSAKTVGLLNATNIPFAYVNVLAAPFIREKLPKISHWPTFPQLFVNGELVGGCDIVEAMSNDGSLLTLLKSTQKTDGLTNNDIEQLVKQGIADSQVFIEGAGCDFTVTVISEQFADLTAVKKQQMVMATLADALGSGKLHAVSVQTYTPDEWQARPVNSAGGLLQIGV